MVNVHQITKKIELREIDPLQLYSKLENNYSYILQSAEGGEKTARYSIIGINPLLHLKINKKIHYKTFDKNLKPPKLKTTDPLNTTKKITKQFKLKNKTKLRYAGGLVGYISYDAIRHNHNPPGHRATGKKDEPKQPYCEFTLARNNIIYDHIKNKAYVTENYFNPREREKSQRRLNRLIDRIMNTEIKPHAKKKLKTGRFRFTANVSESQFKNMVKKAKKYIRAGDVFQVVLSRRITTKCNKDPLEVYKKLKEINPSPYMYYLNFKDRRIAGSSPEMLVRVEDRNVVTYPIAGTRSRGRTLMEDKKLETEMLQDKKEKAEHTMLVDLGRNDVGRIAKHGSIKVRKFMKVEKYSHVQHLISEVTGKLKKDTDCFDALKSIFPAGTVSGAPKIRAMEIIDELEPTRRGIYAGCVGYFSFNGNMDTAITIRTIIFEKNNAYLQTGAGIVADSTPKYEYKETLKKANAPIKALEIA
jgi:anthranilate synthase component 1